MKKILTIFVISILLLGITSAAATIVPQNKTTASPTILAKVLKPHRLDGNNTNGTFTGAFAKKNETGYVILGQLSGIYEKSWQWGGTFSGQWNLTNNTAQGYFQGYFFGYIYFGQINETGTNTTGWIAGLFNKNETINQFKTVAILSDNTDYMIRYAVGTYT
jgi:hypothetical protein